jgi:hypothetical protein
VADTTIDMVVFVFILFFLECISGKCSKTFFNIKCTTYCSNRCTKIWNYIKMYSTYMHVHWLWLIENIIWLFRHLYLKIVRQQWKQIYYLEKMYGYWIQYRFDPQNNNNAYFYISSVFIVFLGWMYRWIYHITPRFRPITLTNI